MAGSKSDYLENKIIDWFFRGVSFTPPTHLYIGLFTVALTDASVSPFTNEVSNSGTNYARVDLAPSTSNWAATNGPTTTTNPSSGTGGQTSNNIAITFNTPSASWGTVVAFGIFDAATWQGGNLLYWGDLTVPKTISANDAAPSFAISQLVITEG